MKIDLISRLFIVVNPLRLIYTYSYNSEEFLC